MLAEAVDRGVSEEQPANHIACAPFHRNSQITAHRQVPSGHAAMREIVTVSRILRDIGASDDGGAFEGWLEDGGISRHRKLREGLSRNARDRIERVRLAPVVHDVVEEGAEFRRGELGSGIRHRLDDPFPIEVGGDDGADVVERFRNRRVLLDETHPFRFRLVEQRDVARDLRGADDPAGLVAHR